jgi:heme transport system substrate-binding protein
MTMRRGTSFLRRIAALLTAATLMVAALMMTALMAPAAAGAPQGGTHGQPARDTSRIVSIGGAVTEILYALGLEQRIVAVDATSHYPPQALREKRSVGYFRQLSPEGVLGLNPSLILAIEGAGPKQAMTVIEAAGVGFVSVPDRFTGEGIIEKIRVIAAAAGVERRGECLAKAVSDDLDTLARLRTGIGQPTRALFLLSFVGERAQVAGRATAAEGIMRLAGGVNAITEFEGYKPVSDEAIIAAQPQAVLAMQREVLPLDARTVFAHQAFALTPAAKRQALVAMNGLYLLGFGPRTALAARDLASQLHPTLPKTVIPSERTSPERCLG